MRETFILAPGANPAELLRSLARHGVNSINTRIVSAPELAETALMRSGIATAERYITREEEIPYVAPLMRDCGYFDTVSYKDAQNFVRAMDSVRHLIPEDEERSFEEKLSGGVFREKNSAIIGIYKGYIERLKEERAIDSIQYIRKAISSAKKIDADFIVLNEYPVTPLERKLLDTLTDSVSEISLSDLFGREKKKAEIEKYTAAYGASNEVEDIIAYIFKNNIKADSCTVAVASGAEYAQLFYDICLSNNIGVTFGSGIPISNSNPAALLMLLNEWDSVKYNNINSIRAILYSDAFDRNKFFELIGRDYCSRGKLAELAGNLMISFDKEENDRRIREFESVTDRIPDEKERGWKKEYIPYLRSLSDELSKGVSYFISTYSVIRDGMAGRIDRSAVKVICECVDNYMNFDSENTELSVIMPEILSKTVCSENSMEGCLYVTSIASAPASLREHLFVTGLSAANYPGSPKENYLILDDDYMLFGDDAPTSGKLIDKKKQQLTDLIDLASALGNKIYLSYSDYNMSELKKVNPSSCLFEIYKKDKGWDVSIKDFLADIDHVGFFEDITGPDSIIGKRYLEGKDIAGSICEPAGAGDYDKKYSFSPSAVDNFLSCPKKFFYANILKIAVEDEDNAFEVMPANDFGSLVHRVMEMIRDYPVKEEYLTECGLMFDDYLKEHCPLHIQSAGSRRDEFMSIVEKAYDNDDRSSQILMSEERIGDTDHPSGIKLHGVCDRLEKRADGKLVVVDFKTGRNINHKEQDPVTCIQGLLYAHMIKENYGYDIDSCEFRYLRQGKSIYCRNNEDNRKVVLEILSRIKDAIDSNRFETGDGCKYCNYAFICKKESEGEDEDD